MAPESNRDNWVSPPAQSIPPPTYAPAALALGVAFVFFGIVTSYLFCIAGAVIMGLALKRWIGAMADGD
jgi:hypothetical protein